MKTETAIVIKLHELESDDRLKGPAATVFNNAPKALIQQGLESQIDILKWVLKD